MDRFSPHRPLVFGHRGASARAPENTLPAFQLALDSGADGIELDVHLTRDGQVIVMHDRQVSRTTNGQGRLADLTVAQIQQFDAGGWFGPAFANTPAPTLEQVFQTFGLRLLYDLEIKNYYAPFNGLEKKVMDLVRRFGLQRRVMISSFSPRSIWIFRRKMPEAPAMLLLVGGAPGRAEFQWVGRWASPDLIGLYHREVPGFVRRFCDARRVLTWGPQTPQEVLQAAALGVDGIIVDDPVMARQALDETSDDPFLKKDKTAILG